MPRKRADAPPPWWLEPLAWRLAETMEIAQSDGRPKDADTLALNSLLHHVEIGRLMRQLTARNAPAALPIADTLRPPQVGLINGLPPFEAVASLLDRPLGSPVSFLETLPGTDALTPVIDRMRPPLDRLPTEKRRQINAAAHLIETALIAARWPTQIVVGGPHDLNDAGDVVGVERVRHVEAWRRKGVDYARLLHAKGVCGKLIGATNVLFSKPRVMVACTLTKMVTGVPLSFAEVRKLTERR